MPQGHLRSSKRWIGWCIRAVKDCPKPGLPNLRGNLLSLWDQDLGPALILRLPASGDREIIPRSSAFGFGECGARRWPGHNGWKTLGNVKFPNVEPSPGHLKTQATGEKFWNVRCNYGSACAQGYILGVWNEL